MQANMQSPYKVDDILRKFLVIFFLYLFTFCFFADIIDIHKKTRKSNLIGLAEAETVK